VTEHPCEVWFYHLERSRLEQVLPDLLERTLARGWRALVRSTDTDRIGQLDEWLWSYRDDGFLAHGVEGEPFAERQPILLAASGADNPNGARVLFLIDGAEAGDLGAFERCVVIFDGQDESALAHARSQWALFRSQGREVAYWRQRAQSGWEKQS
jgi:DNA polymerase-3 subunit chi